MRNHGFTKQNYRSVLQNKQKQMTPIKAKEHNLRKLNDKHEKENHRNQRNPRWNLSKRIEAHQNNRRLHWKTQENIS